MIMIIAISCIAVVLMSVWGFINLANAGNNFDKEK